MKKIEWDDSLSVGIDVIDGQHKRWIEHFNSVVDAVESRGGHAPVTRTLGFLIDYTDLHFSTEERFMTQTAYPRIAGHKAKHEELRTTVANLIGDFEEEGDTPALEQAIDTFLGTWLIEHIKSTDQLFGAFVKESGIVLSEE
jgi:hemerythrin